MKLKKYWEIFLFSLKSQINFSVDYLFSLVSFGIFIFIFNQLWEYVLAGKEVVGYSKEELIWYIIIAELITCSVPKIYKKISDKIKNGDIAILLTKPISMIDYFFVENITCFIKVGIYLIFGLFIGFVLAGQIEMSISNAILFIIALIVAIISQILLQLLIGVIAFFTEENHAFYLILQKIGFLLVFTPLEFYPEFVQKILLCLPTTYTFYVPAKIFSNHPNISVALKLLITECLMMSILWIVVHGLYRRGVKKINVNGG